MRKANRVSATAHDYLRRVVAANLGERFAYLDVLKPLEQMQFTVAFQQLLDEGFVDRVHEGCGRWSYRVTRSGFDAVRG